MDNFLDWLAPIMSTLITTGGLALINAKINMGERKRDEARAETEEKRAAEAKWRGEVIDRLDAQDAKLDEQAKTISTVLTQQCSQTRSDILHKCHRYLDDIGKASIEEKEALHAEHEEYAQICKANGIENSFIDALVQRVMELPEREF